MLRCFSASKVRVRLPDTLLRVPDHLVQRKILIRLRQRWSDKRTCMYTLRRQGDILGGKLEGTHGSAGGVGQLLHSDFAVPPSDSCAGWLVFSFSMCGDQRCAPGCFPVRLIILSNYLQLWLIAWTLACRIAPTYVLFVAGD
jgi:hypothetical protein